MIEPLIFAVLNRARGSKFFDLTTSTQVARIMATLGMALVILFTTQNIYAFAWVWGSLFLWSVPGWGVYQSAATGNPTDFNEKEFAPADWVMKKIGYFEPVYYGTATRFQKRLWGAVAMGLRQMLLIPCIVGLAAITGGAGWGMIVTPFIGLIYMAVGYAVKSAHIMWSEYLTGALIGILLISQ